ncbi:MAG: sigma 54-interacting transcriptional regulator [Deltaproteobacteria bacterium]
MQTKIAQRRWGDLATTLLKPEAILEWVDAAGRHQERIDGPVTVGSSSQCAICIDDATVSRIHLELDPRDDGVWVRDLNSRNGVYCERVRIMHGRVHDGAFLLVGDTEIRIRQAPASSPTGLWPSAQFGPLLGQSVVMRDLFQRLERFARSQATVLIHGETGTGKELVAQAIHEHSSRKDGPFLIVDCGAIQENLLEAELFGHTRGAFSGATTERDGAFIEADGGTLFLDEVGEIPLNMQSKLLRAIESRMVRRLGENQHTKVDVRFVCASHRDLREMVNLGTFREDLYFRMAVLVVEVPPLRERREDIAMLVKHFMPVPGQAGHMNEQLAAELTRRTWSGNVRELRNTTERAMALGWREALDGTESRPSRASLAPGPGVGGAIRGGGGVGGAASVFPAAMLLGGFAELRRRATELWEREYLTGLLARNHGNSAKAAVEAAISRSYLWKAMARHGM